MEIENVLKKLESELVDCENNLAYATNNEPDFVDYCDGRVSSLQFAVNLLKSFIENKKGVAI